ncbi:MAG: Ig-like domain-containing protein [Polyangiaceae bacterium]
MLANGPHSIAVRAKDSVGNVDATPATATWTVDTVAPNTTIATRPTNPTADATGDFTFTSNESPVTFECSVDNGAFAACAATFATSALASGSHTIAVRARDAAGNVDATPDTYTWVVDTTAPDTTIATRPTNPTNDATGDFTFTSNDGTATFECRVDAAAFAACPATFATSALADGSHTLQVRAKDALGNTDATPDSYTWVVDTAPPNTTILTNPGATTTDTTGDFTFGSSETPSTFECSIDSGTFAACTATFATTPLAVGPHTISVRAKDAAGNVDPSPATFTWTVTAPVVDTDGDGLSDGDEGTLGTDPRDADTDDDGILDGAEPSPGTDTDGDGLINARDPDSDNDGILDGTETGVTTPSSATDTTKGHFVPDADPTTTTNPLDPDTDHGGVRDGSEDPNHNGKIDTGERNPNNPADDTTPVVDTDGDGLSDDEERKIGTNPMDADSDDDGLLDGAEPNPSVDTDHDGLINPLDPDSDDDGLFDGTEAGKDCSNKDTLVTRGLCRADADGGATVTSSIVADTDGGGVKDGSEDANLDGAKGANETDPTAGHGADDRNVVDTDGDGLSDGTEGTLGSNPRDADSDDDGVLDGDEPNPSADGDDDGLIDVLDVDSDNDGLLDGTEMSKDCKSTATSVTLGHCRADADPTTHTSAVNPDTDGGGVRDGSEDHDLDGKLDPGETDPTSGHSADDSSVVDSDGDGLSDGTEGTLGSNPLDADSDDDGLLDGEEPNPSDDRDGDGLIDVLDSDSDGDGLFDGTEAGRNCSNSATDASKKQCIADGDQGKTRTRVLIADTDHGGVSDGVEDKNHDGVQQSNERNPLDAVDDSLVVDEGGAGGGLGEAGAGGEAGAASGGRASGGATSGGAASGGASSGGATSGGASSGGTTSSGGANAGAAGKDDHVVVLGGGLCAYRPAHAPNNVAWLAAALLGVTALRRRSGRGRTHAKERAPASLSFSKGGCTQSMCIHDEPVKVLCS